MPIFTILGVEEKGEASNLAELRRKIVALADLYEVPPHWMRVFFPPDLADFQTSPEDGGNNVVILAETMKFDRAEVDVEPGQITKDPVTARIEDILVRTVNTVWEHFGGLYNVEMMMPTFGKPPKRWHHSRKAEPPAPPLREEHPTLGELELAKTG